MIITILKIVIVMTILVAMVCVLLGIHHFFSDEHKRDDAEEIDRLRKDVRQSNRVITRDSTFHDFLARDARRR